MESICKYWPTLNKKRNGMTELARHIKSPWCLCSIPFSHDKSPERSLKEEAYVTFSRFLGETKIIILFAFVHHGQISNRLNSWKYNLHYMFYEGANGVNS